MRIENKLPLALATTGLVLFATYSVVLLRSENRDLRAVASREAALLGRSLRVSIENALRDHQLTDVQETLANLETIDPAVDLLIYDVAGTLTASSEGNVGTEALEGGAAREALRTGETTVRFEPEDSPQRLLFASPLSDESGDPVGALVVARPLTAMNEDLESTRNGALLSVGGFFIAALVVGKVLSTAYIGRPLAALTQAMRRVRQGDLDSSVVSSRHDEVGDVAAEFNQMTHALHEAQTELARREAAERRLQKALQDADRMVTLGQLAAGLAHEIGSPLQVLNGRAKALLGHADDPGKARRHAEVMAKETDRIASIVEQLLRFARRRPARRDHVDLWQAVRAVLDLLEFESRRRQVAFVTGPRHPAFVRGDLDQLQQVVLNLVRNALEVTPAGRAIYLDIVGETGGETSAAWTLVVRDEGSGIAPETQARLFEPFFTTRSETGGTGLGLAVVRSIVEEHGGQVTAMSEVGRGATFRVTLGASQGG